MRTLATGAAVLAAAATYSISASAGAQTAADTSTTTEGALDSDASGAESSLTTTYTVRPGDTLASIAGDHGTVVADLVGRNVLVDPGQIRPGQVLLVPTEAGLALQAGRAVTLSYTVNPGDTLNTIARRFGTSAASLAGTNGMSDPNLIYVGQVIAVPLSTRNGSGSGATLVLPPNAFSDPALTPPGGVTTPPPPPTIPPTQPTTPPPPPSSGGTPPSAPATTPRLPASLFGSLANDPNRLALVPLFDRWADNYRIPRELLKGFAFVESGWRPDALSSSGAQGLGQLMPDTSRWIASTLIGDPSLDPTKPEDNIRMSARYIRYLLDQTGDENVAIGAYYQGIGSVQREGLKPVTLQYINRVQTARAAFV